MQEEGSYNNIISISDDVDIVLSNKDDSECFLTYYIKEIISEEALNRIIKNVEKLFRQSKEYKEYIGILRNSVNLHHCSFLKNANDADVEIEFHHYPFSLYEIVEILINKHILTKDPFSTFSLCSELLSLHYDNKIGLVPVSITIHQLIHSNKLFVNLNQVFGYYTRFVTEYEAYFRIYHKEKYNKIIERSKQELDPDVGILDCEPLVINKNDALNFLIEFDE